MKPFTRVVYRALIFTAVAAPLATLLELSFTNGEERWPQLLLVWFVSFFSVSLVVEYISARKRAKMNR